MIYDDPLITYDGMPTDAYFVRLPALTAEAILAAAQSTPIHVDVRRMNAAPVIGDGSASDPWRGTGVSP